ARDRAVLLRIRGDPLERGVVEVRHYRARLELDSRDRERVVDLFDRAASLCFNTRRRGPVFLEAGTDRHAETSRLRGREKLFWVRSRSVLEPRREIVLPA